MTIIFLESKATQVQPVRVVKLEVKPGDSIRTVLPSTPLGNVPPKPLPVAESTTLVRDFILSFKELENYK